MNQEKYKILDMIERGTITPADGAGFPWGSQFACWWLCCWDCSAGRWLSGNGEGVPLEKDRENRVILDFF